MASIENRSHYQVSVKHRDDLTRTFAHNAKNAVDDYCRSLEAQKLKPRVSRLDNSFVIRDRSVNRKNQTLYATSALEARDVKRRLESEHRRSIFTDYATAYQTTLADLLIRYLREEAPRHKSFEVVAYKINALLEDVGLVREDLTSIVKSHPNPHPNVVRMKIRKPVGKRMGTLCEASKFIRKPFARVVPEDFRDYIDERSQAVAPATVDREIDIFSAVCRHAIDTWRIHVEKSPMDGVKRPQYYNERDRRLSRDEEMRLMDAAREQDRRASFERRVDDLVHEKQDDADETVTRYRHLQHLHASRVEAEATTNSIPYFETFIQFQLMTGARRTETLTLLWSNVDLDEQTALLPDTKNGRSRKLPLRSDLVAMLERLPRQGELVFPIGVDQLRKAWARMCEDAGLTGENELRVHDLRHEAISRVAEAGSETPGGFSLIDLQHFSGHRDVRMLLRYAHLCTRSLAERLDAAFASKKESVMHRGRRRLKAGAAVTMREVVESSHETSSVTVQPDTTGHETSVRKDDSVLGANIIVGNFGRKAA